MAFKAEFRKWLPNLTPGVWLQALPLLVMFSALWMTAESVLDLFPNTVKFWEYVIYGWVYGLTGYWIGLVVCIRYLRARWLAVLFAWFYLLLYGINTGMLRAAGSILTHFYIRIADSTNWEPYFTKWMWILAGIYALSSLVASYLIWKCAPTLKQVRVRSLVFLLILLWSAVQASKHNYFHPSSVFTKMAGQRRSGAWQVTQTETLRLVADNPVIIFGRALFTQWHPLQVRPASELNTMSDTIRAWHLALGPRQYPPLGLKPFNHIVVFATESLSLDFLSPYNTNLPPELTPFYGSTVVTQAMFLNYKTVGLPTQPGLAVTYNSHPNVRALLVGNSDLSLVKFLNAQGYETYVLMPGSETFLNNKMFFTKLGFQHVIGLEHWEQDPKMLPFIEGRGLMDRALYDAVLNLLSQNRDKKIFIHVLNVDTHGPVPRNFFGPLQYPPVPDIEKLVPSSIGDSDDQARAVLAGIFRHDYDIGLTIHRMEAMNLLTDDTLVVLTADHCFPPTRALADIPGYPGGIFERIPLAFLSGQLLPAADLKTPHSQLDFAPTIAHLLGLPVPQGWWGDSVFAPGRIAPYVTRFNDKLIIESSGVSQSISISRPADQSASNLVDLFQKLYVDPAQMKN
jgi:hypothetical protein